MITSSFLHRSECCSLGGYLASIHNKEENDFVHNLIKSHNKKKAYLWLGATCVQGVQKWDDGTPWDYENWNPGYLSNLLCFYTRILEATKHDQVIQTKTTAQVSSKKICV